MKGPMFERGDVGAVMRIFESNKAAIRAALEGIPCLRPMLVDYRDKANGGVPRQETSTLRDEFDTLMTELYRWRDSAQTAEAKLASVSDQAERLTRLERQLEAAEAAVIRIQGAHDVKAAALREALSQIDEEKIQLRIMYAVDDAIRIEVARHNVTKGELAKVRDEAEELRRSKKRLRQALNEAVGR